MERNGRPPCVFVFWLTLPCHAHILINGYTWMTCNGVALLELTKSHKSKIPSIPPPSYVTNTHPQNPMEWTTPTYGQFLLWWLGLQVAGCGHSTSTHWGIQFSTWKEQSVSGETLSLKEECVKSSWFKSWDTPRPKGDELSLKGVCGSQQG